MLKLIDIDQSFFHEEPVVRLIEVGPGSGSMVKFASDDRISKFASEITPEPDKIYVHILAMGAGEYFGANRNADYFPEENLIKWHDTFRTSPAHIFKHHINKNPEIAIGKVVFSVYNERMHRVEVIAWVDRDKGWDMVERIEKGEFPSTSMACHTPYDTCSICGNKARSRGEYCEHLRNELGRIHPDGTKTMALNDGPLKFFDMSFVFKPADITSGVLQKVANHRRGGHAFDRAEVGSAEAAELFGLTEKKAEIRKLSELIKEVEGTVVGSSPSLKSLLSRVRDPDEEVIGMIEAYELDHVIHALADLGISPSVGFFAKLIGRKICGESVDGIEHLVSGLIQEDAGALPVPEFTKSASELSQVDLEKIKVLLHPTSVGSSLFPEAILARSLSGGPQDSRTLVRSPTYAPPDFMDSGNVGYVGNGPHVAPDPRVSYRTLRDVYKEKTSDGSSLLKTLFTVGGIAIAAKWLVSKLISEKLKELDRNREGSVKILLVKSASEAKAVDSLVKASLFNSLITGH